LAGLQLSSPTPAPGWPQPPCLRPPPAPGWPQQPRPHRRPRPGRKGSWGPHPRRDGRTRAAKAAAPRLRRGRRCRWGPHRRRDGREPHARRARIPPALGPLTPPAPGGVGRCGGRPRVASSRSSAVAPRGLGRLSPLHDGQPREYSLLYGSTPEPTRNRMDQIT